MSIAAPAVSSSSVRTWQMVKRIFTVCHAIGVGGLILLFILVEIVAILDNPIQILNPFLHVMIALGLLLVPVTWVLLFLSGVGWWMSEHAEKKLAAATSAPEVGARPRHLLTLSQEAQALVAWQSRVRTSMDAALAMPDHQLAGKIVELRKFGERVDAVVTDGDAEGMQMVLSSAIAAAVAGLTARYDEESSVFARSLFLEFEEQMLEFDDLVEAFVD